MIWLAMVAALFTLFLSSESGQVQSESSSGESGVVVSANGLRSPYAVISVFVLPGDTVEITMNELAGPAVLKAGHGVVLDLDRSRWKWVPPSRTGLYKGSILSDGVQTPVEINLFVMIPSSAIRDEYLNGYRIGVYPKKALRGLESYKPPKGFIEVTKENEETLLSPHFRLKQFLCKQKGEYPKYVVLRQKLLLKLEMILERVSKRGLRARSFNILSGYRTPFYNKAIGNVRYSRHVYGGAADIFIDEVAPYGMMDDLNSDGKHDLRDAEVLEGLIGEMFGGKWYEPYVGGLGAYGKTSSHGPFVHVDVRGFKARW